MNHKPMLAVDCGDLDTVAFPVFASPKLDGVRAIITADGVLSRSLKPIPNRRVQELLRGLPVGLDGELMVGDPCAPDVYRRTVSVVMSDDAPIDGIDGSDGLRFHVFDYQTDGGYSYRRRILENEFEDFWEFSHLALVPNVHLSRRGLEECEAEWVAAGYEGAMLRTPDGPYKHGRSTRKEGYLLKLKRFVDSEAVVIGVTELMHNGNEAKTNELGRTARSSAQAGKTGTGVLGALRVRDVKTGVEFEIGTGFTAAERALYFAPFGHRVGGMPGLLAKYKYFPGGSKDKPRFPVFLGWRSSLDT